MRSSWQIRAGTLCAAEGGRRPLLKLPNNTLFACTHHTHPRSFEADCFDHKGTGGRVNQESSIELRRAPSDASRLIELGSGSPDTFLFSAACRFQRIRFRQAGQAISLHGVNSLCLGRRPSALASEGKRLDMRLGSLLCSFRVRQRPNQASHKSSLRLEVSSNLTRSLVDEVRGWRSAP